MQRGNWMQLRSLPMFQHLQKQKKDTMAARQRLVCFLKLIHFFGGKAWKLQSPLELNICLHQLRTDSRLQWESGQILRGETGILLNMFGQAFRNCVRLKYTVNHFMVCFGGWGIPVSPFSDRHAPCLCCLLRDSVSSNATMQRWDMAWTCSFTGAPWHSCISELVYGKICRNPSMLGWLKPMVSSGFLRKVCSKKPTEYNCSIRMQNGFAWKQGTTKSPWFLIIRPYSSY